MNIIEAAKSVIEGKQVSRPENLTTMEICTCCSCRDFLIDGENTELRLEDIIAQDWEVVGERRKG